MACSKARNSDVIENKSTAGIAGISGAVITTIDRASSARTQTGINASPKNGMAKKAAPILKKGHHNWPSHCEISANVICINQSSWNVVEQVVE
ncbi:hypothetical protein JCM19240_3053 [Vibrio maritimus]|uniref:Uncharacterized protein n=1 Tax=Vibrio maritimus TaxID=990268 RepID=A0A090TEB6_9VIBR|nr:hypothetical protein JCM19240_3053 [Vibrio maritimus]